MKMTLIELAIYFDLIFKEFPKAHLLKTFSLDELEDQNGT
jgi:hypothetical protein